MSVISNFVVNPVDVDNRYHEQDDISEQTYRWERVSSLNFIEEHQLKQLTNKEHQIKVAQNLDQDESVVNKVHAVFVLMFHIRNLFKQINNFCFVVGDENF
tara:strand:+ start:2102 stop:2404 length:303 start_codon:yes stop_codon:yes gene_type:complete